jgi:AraC-like DNA-binding protein
MTIAEVAERLGYAELSYFSRAFKREAGMPPAAYRVASRANDGSRQAR